MIIDMSNSEEAAATGQTQSRAEREVQTAIRNAQEAARAAAQEAQRAAEQARSAQPALAPVQAIPPVPPVPAFPGGGFTIQNGGFDPNNVIPPQAVDIAMGFFIMCAVIVIGLPLARAFGRRLERRTDVPAANPQLAEQLQRIEQAVDAVSIEVERISESQRFMAKLQQERVALPVDRS